MSTKHSHKVYIIGRRVLVSSTHGDDAMDAFSLQHVSKGLVDLRKWYCVSENFSSSNSLFMYFLTTPGMSVLGL